MNLSFLAAALRRLPRATSWLLAAAALLAAIAVISPVQLPVVLYKAALLSLPSAMQRLPRCRWSYRRTCKTRRLWCWTPRTHNRLTCWCMT